MHSVLEQLFSKARLKPYIKEGQSGEQALDCYHYNIQLSESMQPSLHYLEIILRNRIDTVIKQYISNDWLRECSASLKMSDVNVKKIALIKDDLLKTRGFVTHDDIIAQMTFGFWCAFFHKRYDPLLWHKKEALKIVFPQLVRRNRKREYIEERLLKIKAIRNRIAHYEPIWQSQPTVVEIHMLIGELITAMSPEASDLLAIIDRFPHVCRDFDLPA